MPILVIVRHGQSVWNLENKFTGEADVELTAKGREEAQEAGKDLREIKFDCCFTSVLKRAEETLDIILEEIQQEGIPVTRNKALNERNYGDLQGLNKTDIAKKYGEEQVAIWRRSYAVKPPGGESLQDTAARVIPYYKKNVEPLLREKKNVLIVAHGNSLRALMMYLENISAETIATVDLPTAAPRVYTMTEELKVLRIVVYKEVNL
jgi:2,3-bisphosphoglycerate-dependent phosphoglycerate mutase